MTDLTRRIDAFLAESEGLDLSSFTFEVEEEYEELTVRAIDEHDRQIGYVTLRQAKWEGLESDCAEARSSMESEAGDLDLYVVDFATVRSTHRGEGLGTELYVRAIEAAAERGGAVAPGACHSGFRSTNSSALRVWSSSTLQSRVTVWDGRLAWGG